MQPQLTEMNVLDIKRIIKYGKINKRLNKTKIANDFDVSRKTIYDIETGDTWSHVRLPRENKKYPGYLVYQNGKVFDTNVKYFVPVYYKDNRLVKDGYDGFVYIKSKYRKYVSIPVAQLLTETFGKKFGKSFLRLS